MKTIYVPVDSKVYKVNQDTRIPSTMCIKQPGYSSSLTKDPDNSTIIQSIDINTVLSQTHAAKTNGELYLDLLELLREKKITEIPIITNNYKVYVDYTLFVDNKETDRSVVIKAVKPMDQVLPLGCSYNSELLYRRVTDVKANVCFKVRNTLPYGVMNQRKQNYMIQINDISIFQDFATYTDNHLSTFETPYPVGSKNVNSALDSCVLMYSTDADGVIIQPVSLNFAPRTVNININVILGHMVVAYDSKEVDDIVKYNIHHKYHPDDPYPPCPPIPPCPPPYPPGPWPPGPFPPGPFPPPMPDPHPTADGDDNPDAEGHSDWYERASETNPGALLVVEDMYEPQYFDPSVMIHKRKVIRDIPDIRVGEYVLYREGFEATLN